MPNLGRKAFRQRRHWRIRKRIAGTAETPRACVYISGRHIYIQFIDDTKGHTIASASTLSAESKKQKIAANCAGGAVVGKKAADKMLALGISRVVFDRGGFKYHGRVKSIADAMREAGLKL